MFVFCIYKIARFSENAENVMNSEITKDDIIQKFKSDEFERTGALMERTHSSLFHVDDA